jgi:adenosylcobinamide-phosphate synthase
MKAAGFLFPIVLSGLFGGGSAVLLWFLRKFIGPAAQTALDIFWSYQLLAARSLYDHVRAVDLALQSEDLERGRLTISRIVGRDTTRLTERGIARGALESLSENANDALVAPLFFLLLGGVPLLMAYKAISTLDSMVGYKNGRYRDLGFASARCDDLLAYLPARLTFVLMMIVLLPFILPEDGGAKLFGSDSVLCTALRFRRAHPSPTSGYPMAAYAALLGVRLGGGASYFGHWMEKPVIGTGRDPGREDLSMGLRLYRMFVFSLIVLLAGATYLGNGLHG